MSSHTSGELVMRWLFVMTFIYGGGRVNGQNPIFNQPVNNPINGNQGQSNTYYFDKQSDCNKAIRNIYDYQATIEGHGSGSQQRGPESCTIRLKSEQQFQGVILEIQIRSMDIRDCTTRVVVYDGDSSDNPMGSWDCNSDLRLNQKNLKTSGNTATFVMKRDNVEQWNFDVEIIVNPIRGGTVPGEENNYGRDFYFDKFSQKSIIGIIGGFYLFVVLVCTAVVVRKWFAFSRGTQRWETHQLAAMKTDAGFDGRSQTSYPTTTRAWSTAHSRPPPSQYSRTHTDAYSRSKYGPHSEDGDSGVFRYDETFQKHRLMNEDRASERPPTYASRNASYVEPPEEAEDNFKEKVITPRVHRRKKRHSGRPPSYDDAMSDPPSEVSSSEEEESEESSDESVRKRRPSSDEESHSSKSETESEEESEEDDSDDNSRHGGGARGGRRRRASNSNRRKPKSSKASSRDSRDSRDTRDGVGRPYRRNGAAAQPAPMHGMPYPAYPAGVPPGYPPGQFVPVMAGPPPQYQPVPIMPAMVPTQQQHIPEDAAAYHQSEPRQPNVQPTDPPVYSYLVRRGYNPIDASGGSGGGGSVAGSQRSRSREEPDQRLSTGVEYMRR